MVLKIRLARFGTRNMPLYNIVIAHEHSARNSLPVEVIGTYDPSPRPDPYATMPGGALCKEARLDTQRARYWLGVGAQPSNKVWKLLNMVGILPRKESGKGKPEATKEVNADEVHIL